MTKDILATLQNEKTTLEQGRNNVNAEKYRSVWYESIPIIEEYKISRPFQHTKHKQEIVGYNQIRHESFNHAGYNNEIQYWQNQINNLQLLITTIAENYQDANKVIGDKTIMQLVLESGREECIKNMLESKADFSDAIAIFIVKDDIENIKKIHQIDPQVLVNMNYKQNTKALELAIAHKAYNVMEFLLSDNNNLYSNIDFYKGSTDGKSLMQVVLEKGSQTCIKKMLNSGMNFTNAISTLVVQDDVENIKKIHQIDPQVLTNVRFAGNVIKLLELVIACSAYNLMEFLLLENSGLYNKIDFNTKNVDLKSFMQIVLENGSQRCIEKMLSSGADFSTSIAELTMKDDVENITKIHQINPQVLANMNYADTKVLELAIVYSAYNVMEFLLTNNSNLYSKIDFNKRSPDGRSLMQLVLEQGSKTCIKNMLESEADFSTSILGIVLKDDVENIKKIYQADSQVLVNMKYYKNAKILELAIASNAYKTMEFLLSDNNNLYSNIDFNKRSTGSKSLMQIVLEKGSQTCIKKMFNSGADFTDAIAKIVVNDDVENIKTIHQINPQVLANMNYGDNTKILELAIACNAYKTMEFLLLENSNLYSTIDFSKTNANGQTLVQILLERGSPTCIEKMLNSHLLEKITSEELINLNDTAGNNLLHLACKYGNKVLLEKLLEHNAELVNSQNNAGQTMLHILFEDTHFSEQQLVDFIRIISKYAPDITILDNLGETAMHLTKGHSTIQTILQTHHLLNQDNAEIVNREVDNAALVDNFNDLNLAGDIEHDMH